MEDQRLSREEERELLDKIYNGTPQEVNSAWEKIYTTYKEYIIRSLVKERLDCIDKLPDVISRQELIDDLEQAGWSGFCESFLTYDIEGEAKLLTYAKPAMEREINREFFVQMNTLGIADRPYRFARRVDVDDLDFVSKGDEHCEGIDIPEGSKLGDFSTERLTLQLLKILREQTDKEHKVSSKELFGLLKAYRNGVYKNTSNEADNKLYKTFAEMFMELGNDRICITNEKAYVEKLRMEKFKVTKWTRDTGNIYYDHPFDNDTLDRLIMLVNFSDLFDTEEKEKVISELIDTASRYYNNPLADGGKKCICGRYGTRSQVSRNIIAIQKAINNLEQIRFWFNKYTEDGEMIHTTREPHIISPYHTICYHDNFFLIGMRKGDDHIKHFRIDLMSDVEVMKGVPIELATAGAFPLLTGNWDPEKYMAQHLYMGYDNPRLIRMKIDCSDDRIYTTLHEWFGDHFKLTDEPCEEGFKIVELTTSPAMMVPFALQYSDKLEVLDEGIREKIKEKIEFLNIKYR